MLRGTILAMRKGTHPGHEETMGTHNASESEAAQSRGNPSAFVFVGFT
jgi:hypothetical protein